MTLPSGTKLGPYEIQSPLGAGGMGEVYRARDTRLERDVAIKVLPADLSSDPNLRQRLDREAKAVSKLSHPNICTLHDVGHQDGVDFLVMELVEGETLEQRLQKGPLPPDQTVRIAAQIADALARAHKLGFTHRDLKPANVMLTKAGAKLMDFGLAKQSGPAPLATALTEMTMEHAKLTSEGMLVGTFQYMSPEQLEGKEADHRADIFALGELIYEMATGKPAFVGKSRASLIAAILTTEPTPMESLQPMTPVSLGRIVRKCLAKDPDERWQSASDLAAELKWIAEGGSQTSATVVAPPPRAAESRAGWILAALFLSLAIVAGIAWWTGGSHHQPRSMYFHAALPFAPNDVSLSADGRMLAMVGYTSAANDYTLWVSEVGSRRTTALEGTHGANYPFWSPDAKSLGFFADGKLKKIEIAGGQVQVLADAPNGRGGAWNRDGTILFAADALGPLLRISSSGGTPSEATKVDASRSEAGHRWPMFLPDGKHFLYLAANFSGRPGINAIFVGSLDSTEKRFVVNSRANAAYSEPGFLIFLRDQTLVAQPFDLRNYSLSGEAHVLSNEVLIFPQVYRAAFSVAGPELLVAQTGNGVYQSQLTWFDRSGKSVGIAGKPSWYNNVQLAPDGKRIATDQTDQNGQNIDVWVLDPARDASTRLTFDPALDTTPSWNPDGRQLVFSSNRSLDFKLYLKNADGSGVEQPIAEAGKSAFNSLDWSHDGKYILTRRSNELWYFTLADRLQKPLVQGWVVKGAQFSPDDRWVAYTSNESGTTEVYVAPFPGGNGKWQVSHGGATEPRWRKDGKELFFLSQDSKMMAVPVSLGGSFESGSPVALFQTHRRQAISSQDTYSYDVSADGQRFLIATQVDESTTAPLTVLLNWASEMAK
ncbi:MAG TPA: protein kinase [Terriglobales bacterium]|jgi:Tol biopolymer transport system component|nr:protein kinase [Terriglobales bacterium]